MTSPSPTVSAGHHRRMTTATWNGAVIAESERKDAARETTGRVGFWKSVEVR